MQNAGKHNMLRQSAKTDTTMYTVSAAWARLQVTEPSDNCSFKLGAGADLLVLTRYTQLHSGRTCTRNTVGLDFFHFISENENSSTCGAN
jgi:hypothetical protein